MIVGAMRQNQSGTFVVVPFTFFELSVLFLDLCIFLCLVLSDVSSELKTQVEVARLSSGFDLPLA